MNDTEDYRSKWITEMGETKILKNYNAHLSDQTEKLQKLYASERGKNITLKSENQIFKEVIKELVKLI